MTAAEQRAASTLLNLLEEPEPEPEPEPTACTSEHGIGGLPTKKNVQRTKRRGEGAALEIRRVVRRHDDRCRKK